MQRRTFLKNTALGAAAGAVAAPAIAQSMPNLQWRFAASWPKSLDVGYGATELIAKRVGELTEGRFQIRPFAGGEIVPPLQVLDAVQAGTVEMGHTALYYYFGKDPAFAFGTSIPFGMTTRQNNAWWYPAWKKFRDEQFLWFRVAEGSYENYTFYSKLGEGK